MMGSGPVKGFAVTLGLGDCDLGVYRDLGYAAIDRALPKSAQA